MEDSKMYDELTKLMSKELFRETVDWFMAGDGAEANEYAMFYIDIRGFKAINEIFGRAEGNQLLIYVAEVLREAFSKEDYITRIAADSFAVFAKGNRMNWNRQAEFILDKISKYELPYEIVCHIGICRVFTLTFLDFQGFARCKPHLYVSFSLVFALMG